MGIKTIVGLGFAGAAAAVVVAGGVAYASDEIGSDTTVRIYQDGAGYEGTAVDDRDCPEKSGGGQSGESATEPSEAGL